MGRKLVLLSASICLLVPVAALAADPYIGASIGRTGVDSYDSRADSWALHGGYRFNQWLAIEASYADSNGAGWSSCRGNCIPEGQYARDFSARRFELSAAGSVPLGRRLALFGTVGVARLDARMRIRGQLTPTSAFIDERSAAQETGFLYSSGIELSLRPSFSTRLQWQHQRADVGDLSGFLVGATYTFGR